MRNVSDEHLRKLKLSLEKELEIGETKHTKVKHLDCDVHNNIMGNVLSQLSKGDDEDFEIEKWSDGVSTKVWKVTRLR